MDSKPAPDLLFWPLVALAVALFLLAATVSGCGSTIIIDDEGGVTVIPPPSFVIPAPQPIEPPRPIPGPHPPIHPAK